MRRGVAGAALATFSKQASTATRFTQWFTRLGVFGLFLLAVLDGMPLPTFGGPDILIIILASSRSHPWWLYTAVATAGAAVGATITFRLARKAGSEYVEKKFKRPTTHALLKVFRRNATGTLMAFCAVPVPFPTSVFFAAAGASRYRTTKFLAVVILSRGVRYSVVALIATRFGGQILALFRHPTQHWEWLLAILLLVVTIIAGTLFLNRRLAA
jgi:membrane protein YqaA with SNARE-associated domain